MKIPGKIIKCEPMASMEHDIVDTINFIIVYLHDITARVEKMEPKPGIHKSGQPDDYSSGASFGGKDQFDKPALQPEQQERTSCDGCDYVDKDDETRCSRCGSNYSLWIHDTNKHVTWKHI